MIEQREREGETEQVQYKEQTMSLSLVNKVLFSSCLHVYIYTHICNRCCCCCLNFLPHSNQRTSKRRKKRKSKREREFGRSHLRIHMLTLFSVAPLPTLYSPVIEWTNEKRLEDHLDSSDFVFPSRHVNISLDPIVFSLTSNLR